MIQNIDTIPSDSETSHLADYIEFRTLIDVDQNYTKADFNTTFTGTVDDEMDNEFEVGSATISDKNRNIASKKWREALKLCKHRNNFFSKGAYPFIIPNNENDIIFLKQRLTRLQKAYLFFLVCSSLKYIMPTEVRSIAREFETTCLSLFKHCLPKGSTVKGNWAQPAEGEDCYTGTLPEKLIAISNDIRSDPDTIKAEDYNPINTGDGGIDLVGWHGMYDDRPGIPIAVGQCSCSKTEWNLKPLESSWNTHKATFPLISPWLNFYFCPLDLWELKNKWRHSDKVKKGDAIFVDRYRMLRIMQKINKPISMTTVNNLRHSIDTD